MALWRSVQVAAGDLDPFGPKFAIGLFDCWAAHPMKSLAKNRKEIMRLFGKFIFNIFAAPWTIAAANARLSESDKVWKYAIIPVFTFAMTIILHIAEIGCNGCWAIAWFFYLCFASYAASVRLQCRSKCGIHGNPFEDFFAVLFMYPNVAVQLDETTAAIGRRMDPEDDAKGTENPGYD